MKKFLLMLLSLGLCMGTAYAGNFWTGSVADSPGKFTADNVLTFDWASSGSGNAQGLGPVGTPLTVGTPFTFRYQSYLFGLTGPDGQNIPFPGLNSDFEYTIVAQFNQNVLGVATNTATFITDTGGQFYIYWDGEPNADTDTGMGFDDGTLVASGTVYPGQISVFTLTNPTLGEGTGSYLLEGLVEFIDTNFLEPGLSIIEFRVEGTLNTPANESETDAYFLSRTGEGNLAPYPVTDSDLAFKADSSSKFTAEDEEPSNCRVTAGGNEETADGMTAIPCVLRLNGTLEPGTCAVEDMGKHIEDTWGGQAGASGIDGNWTHHHKVSPQQSFMFHSNNLDWIECSDPGIPCTAAANAETRQIDFRGTGRFTNQKGYDPALPKHEVCFTVHLEDIGEPGPGGKWPSSAADCTHVPGTPIENPTDCVDCTDYYEIRIYNNLDCTGDPVYVNGDDSQASPLGGYFISGGNVQMHPAK